MHSTQSVVWRVARHELNTLRRDGRLAIAALGMLVLFVGVSLLDWQRFRHDQHERAHFVATARVQWENQGARHPHRAASFGQYVAKPELPLALFDPGIRSSTGQALWLEAHKRSSFGYSPAEDGAITDVLGLESGAQVLQVIGALLVILMGYSCVAREREDGTLRLLLAQGVAPGHWFMGKCLGLGLALTAVALPMLAIFIVLFLTADPAQLSVDTVWRGLALIAGYGLYFLAWVAGTVAVSSRASSARAALTALLALWLIGVVLVPRFASTLASTFAPIPSVTEFSAAQKHDADEGFDGIPGWNEQLAALEKHTLEKYRVDSLEALPVGFSGIRMHAMDEWGNRVSDRHQQRLEALYTRQTRWHLGTAILGPATALRAFSQGMAGTDWLHYQDFSAAAERYRRDVVLSLDERLSETLPGNRWEIAFGHDVWAAVPRFSYIAPSIHWALKQSIVPLLLLVVWAAVACAALWSGARKVAQ